MDWSSNHVTEYEGYYNHDEDTFSTELKRQILLLTTDEDEDFPVTTRLNNSNSSTHKGLSSVIAPAAGSYFSLYGNEHSTNSVPTWLVNLWRKGNGTGSISYFVKTKACPDDKRYHAQDNMQLNTDRNLGFESFDEDDSFYAELRRQVLLLIADDNDDCTMIKSSTLITARKRCSSGLTTSFPTTLQPGSYFNWWERENADSVPTWLVNLWRNGKGTGVKKEQLEEKSIEHRR
ncbi:hypothetical protein Tsubulata_018566, partial [Turnera subulata]